MLSENRENYFYYHGYSIFNVCQYRESNRANRGCFFCFFRRVDTIKRSYIRRFAWLVKHWSQIKCCTFFRWNLFLKKQLFKKNFESVSYVRPPWWIGIFRLNSFGRRGCVRSARCRIAPVRFFLRWVGQIYRWWAFSEIYINITLIKRDIDQMI